MAWRTPGAEMLDGREDRAALWDLRVHPDHRGRGSCTILKVETQNINLPACRLYAGEGCTLASIDALAYPTIPEEVQLIWQYGL